MYYSVALKTLFSLSIFAELDMTRLNDRGQSKSKEIHDMDHSYINDALHCSSIDITVPQNELPHGGLKGSNEFICKCSQISIT